MNKPLILVVDDTPTNIHVLTQALSTEDYRIKIATDGRLALKLAHLPNECPDLILLDVMMPEMDGYEVCRRLKADPKTRGIPVIFVTSLMQEANEMQGLALGAVDYIIKPVNPAIVRARVCNHVALKRKTDLLERLAAIDSLTGLFNRRRFGELLAVEWKRALRHRLPLGLIFADIDHFKQYNDHFGHGGGDRCLIRVAQTVQATMARASDSACRYGGEEFVALLPMSEPAGTAVIAERLRAAIEQLALPHAPTAQLPFVTISVGYISLIPKDGQMVETLIDDADRALYQAKAAGRNCVRSGV
jgi:diguanylate cyclase (GGDEF)-like protein